MLSGLRKVLSLPRGLALLIADGPQIADPQPPQVTDRQQSQLSYLAEMTDNFGYLVGLLNTAADAEEEDSDEICAVVTTNSPRHLDEKEPLAKEDQQMLTAAERLASTPG